VSLQLLPSAAEAGKPLVRRWPRHPRSVSRARHALVQELAVWGLSGLTDPAELVLSELVTNAVQHTRVPRDRLIETHFERMDGGVRIEVHDADENRPAPQVASTEDEAGRGLALVDALTRGRWGADEREGVGKLIWAVITDDADGCADKQRLSQ
jgi:serine/threonine-protein kinase RsbW